MTFHGSSSQLPRRDTNPTEENYNFHSYATSTAHSFGAARREPLYAGTGSQNRRLDYPTAFSIPNTASSGASPSFTTTIMPPKRNSPGDPNATPTSKQVKIENPAEFSNQVKKKLATSTRTGQACDRCKVRKIRCDGLPGGCSPCLQNNTECCTTDRITGRATSRGYVEGLEQQNRDMQHRIQELEQRVIQAGGDIKPSNGFHDSAASNYDYSSSSSIQQSQWTTPGYGQQSSTAITDGQQETNMFRTLPAFRSGCTGDNYLGVSAGNSNLSSIKGTALSILGMEIDIADFESLDMDEPDNSVFHPQLYNKSYQAFLQSALNINPRIEKVDLPARGEGMTYVDWYFRAIHPFLPLLHRPTFMKLITRMYDDPAFRPTTAETVIVHMVFAIMYFQYAARNWEDTDNQPTLTSLSNTHYHYSLSMFYQLSCSHTFQDVQALALICAHLRNFPKPGASWMLTQTTITLAVELGLHRSATRWAPDSSPNALDIEMRKRTFWSLLTIHVTLSGKLGRPMAFRMEDFDVEMPEEIDDELLSEEGFDTSRPGQCRHKPGLHAFRIVPLFLELYNTIYAVRRQPENYIATVNNLELRLRNWKDGLPAEFTKPDANDSETQLYSHYAQAWALEFRLLLRHPSVSMTTDPALNAESMRICVESSRQLLVAVRQMQKLKSLDTTWYNSAVYVMAITTTLFAQWEKSETSVADLTALSEEMDIWLEIMGDVGGLLGAGGRLREAVRVVTDSTLGLLSKRITSKAPSYIKNSEDSKTDVRTASATSTGTYNNPQQYSYDNDATRNGSTSSNYLPPEAPMNHQPTPYPSATQYSSYPENPSGTSTIAYTPQDTHTYTYQPPTTDPVDAPLLAAFAAHAAQTQPPNWRSPPQTLHPNSGSQSWHQWTSTMAGNLDSQDCYSANALMQLGGGREGANGAVSQAGTPMGEISATQVGMEQSVGGMGMAWPLNIFDMGPGGGGAGT